MQKLALLLMASLLMATVHASELRLITGGTSYHYDSVSHAQLNEVHPSLGMAFNGVQVVYTSKNSWGAPSWYVTHYNDFWITDKLLLQPHIGMASGYKEGVTYNGVESSDKYNSSGIIPVIGLATTYYPVNEIDLGLTVTVTPYAAMFNIVWGK